MKLAVIFPGVGYLWAETEDMQRSLMEAEGIQVEWTADGWQVDLKRSGWKNTMEEALGFLEIFEAQGI